MKKHILSLFILTSALSYACDNCESLDVYELKYQREQEKNRLMKEAYRKKAIKYKQDQIQKIIDETNQRNR